MVEEKKEDKCGTGIRERGGQNVRRKKEEDKR